MFCRAFLILRIKSSVLFTNLGSDEYLKIAHNLQSSIITDEVNGKHIQVSVLFVHAQDQLMTTMEVRSLAERFIHLNKKVNQLLERE